MRRLHKFENQNLATGLANKLIAADISSQCSADDQGWHHVWVEDDDQIPQARQILAGFLAAPEEASKPLVAKTSDSNPRHKQIDVRAQWSQLGGSSGDTNLTFSLIALCSIIFLAWEYRVGMEYLQFLAFEDYYYQGQSFVLQEPFTAIRSGQIWRLVTPIFLHFGWMHIIFNMIWLYQLGTAVEAQEGTKKLLSLIVVVAVFSNVLQALWSPAPFGGMSGVIYGLLGYIWGHQRWVIGSQYFIDPGTFGFMMVFLVLCFFGIFGPIANFAHLGGLIMGLAWPYALAQLQRRRF